MKKINKNKKRLGPVTVILIITAFIVLFSAIASIIGLQTEKTTIVNGTLETSLITINNFLSIEGLKYLFSDAVLNFQMFKPLALLIISLIAFGIAEVSGLLQIVSSPLKNIKTTTLTLLTVLVAFISTIVGEYSFVILLPLAGLVYKHTNRNSVLGIITAFLGITLGYASGLIFNYDHYLLGTLTQVAATIDVDPNYVYHNFSTLFIMLGSVVVMVPVVSKLINVLIVPKFKKPMIDESEAVVSKKGLYFSNMTLVFLLLIVAYMIIPGMFGSGILLDKNASTYIAKLFGDASPFKDGIILAFLGIVTICSYIYGRISKNIETSKGFTESMARCLDHCGYLFVLMFFASQMFAILEWTNIGEAFTCKLVEMLSQFQFSGVLLIVIFFILVIVMTILMPSALTKWTVVCPLIVPLFMRANITPELTQFIFQVADGIGKAITPFFAFFIVMLGFMHYNNSDEEYNVTIFGTMKVMMPTIILTAAFWILFLVIWYLAGFPLGISGYTTL